MFQLTVWPFIPDSIAVTILGYTHLLHLYVFIFIVLSSGYLVNFPSLNIDVSIELKKKNWLGPK